MTGASADHLAKEADRLKSDPVFNKALEDIRAEALEELVRAKADDTVTILSLQSRVLVIDEIRNVLDRYIMAADVQEDAGSFA